MSQPSVTLHCGYPPLYFLISLRQGTQLSATTVDNIRAQTRQYVGLKMRPNATEPQLTQAQKALTTTLNSLGEWRIAEGNDWFSESDTSNDEGPMRDDSLLVLPSSNAINRPLLTSLTSASWQSSGDVPDFPRVDQSSTKRQLANSWNPFVGTNLASSRNTGDNPWLRTVKAPCNHVFSPSIFTPESFLKVDNVVSIPLVSAFDYNLDLSVFTQFVGNQSLDASSPFPLEKIRDLRDSIPSSGPSGAQLIALQAVTGPLRNVHIREARLLLGDELWSQIVYLSVRKTKGRFLSNGKVSNRIAIVDWDTLPSLIAGEPSVFAAKEALPCSLGVVQGTTIARDTKRNALSARRLPFEAHTNDVASPPFHPSVTSNQEIDVDISSSESRLLVDTLCRDSSSLPIDIRTAASAVLYPSPSSLDRPSTLVTPSNDIGALPCDGTLPAGRTIPASPVQTDNQSDREGVTVGVHTSLQAETQENEGVFPDSIMGPTAQADLFDGAPAKSMLALEFVGPQNIMSYRAPGVGSFEVTKHADNRNSEKLLDTGVQVGAKHLRSPSVEEEPMKKQKENARQKHTMHRTPKEGEEEPSVGQEVREMGDYVPQSTKTSSDGDRRCRNDYRGTTN
ncbi:hypothetical protein EDD85DRAFT_946413 [Armillaria nabsnona]|nr:hypothetical protein EDD85DRAFT_946413 [Armillaria nabsnona]